MTDAAIPYDHTTSTFKGTAGTPIFYQIRRPASKKARVLMILAHGLGEHSDRFENLYRRLLPEGVVFYAPDHRGFGRSGGKRGHVDRFEDYLADLGHLIRLARQDHPALPLILYGHSMGSLIAMAYAMDHGNATDGLVAASPPIGTPDLPWGKKLRLPVKCLAALWPRFSLRTRGNPSNVTRDPAEADRKRQDRLCHTRISLNWISEFLGARIRIAENARHLAVSSFLMLVGTGDIIISPEAALTFFDETIIADKTVHIYPAYAHELHNDLGRETPLNDVADWLNQRWPHPPG